MQKLWRTGGWEYSLIATATVNFNQVNKIEPGWKVLSLNEELSEVQLLRFTSDLSCFASILFANVNFTQVPT